MNSNQTQFEFTTDWVSNKTDTWYKHFSVLNTQPCRILEIGSYEGRSACWFIQNLMSNPKSDILCIDPWFGTGGAERLRRFDKNILLTGKSDQVSRIKAKVMDVQHNIPSGLDLIYIDGDHVANAALSQAAVVWPKLKVGGFLLFDDYLWNHGPEGVLPPGPGIDAFLSLWGSSLTLLHKDWQIMVQKIKE